MIDQRPKPPYYAVIFTSVRRDGDEARYQAVSAQMEKLAAAQPGYLGHDSARNPGGIGITVSYWRSLEDVHAFRQIAAHTEAQATGRTDWYQWYHSATAKVERDNYFHYTDGKAER